MPEPIIPPTSVNKKSYMSGLPQPNSLSHINSFPAPAATDIPTPNKNKGKSNLVKDIQITIKNEEKNTPA